MYIRRTQSSHSRTHQSLQWIGFITSTTVVSAVQWFHLLAVQWFQCLLQQTDKMLTNALIIVALFLFDSKTFAQMMQPCAKNSACGEGHCCALRLRLFGFKGYCLRTKSLGEVCSPSVKTGKHFTCGCSVGLTCAITDVDKFKNPKYRCVRIPTETPELSEKTRNPDVEPAKDSSYAIMFSKYLQNRFNRLRNKNKKTAKQS